MRCNILFCLTNVIIQIVAFTVIPITIGLASHWPCITDFTGLSTYRFKAQGKETSTLPTFL